MNERIKQLAEKAFESAHGENGNMPMMLEKFAELIVRECMTVARGADGMDATHEAWYLIEQHFGIEE